MLRFFISVCFGMFLLLQVGCSAGNPVVDIMNSRIPKSPDSSEGGTAGRSLFELRDYTFHSAGGYRVRLEVSTEGQTLSSSSSGYHVKWQ